MAQTVTIGGISGVRNIILSKPRWDLLSMNRKIIPATPFSMLHKAGFPVYALRLGKGDGSLATSAPEECHTILLVNPRRTSCEQNFTGRTEASRSKIFSTRA
jgi:hypothetical protein